MSTDFVWTDELAKEYAEQYRFSSSRISIEQFKESKQPKLDTEKWQSVQQIVERYEKALKHISEYSKTDEGDVYEADAAYRYDIIIERAREALTPKTGSDDTDK